MSSLPSSRHFLATFKRTSCPFHVSMRPTKETRKRAFFFQFVCIRSYSALFGSKGGITLVRSREEDAFYGEYLCEQLLNSKNMICMTKHGSEKFWSGKIVHKMRPWNSQKSGEKTSTNRITVYERNILFLNYFSKTENCLEKSTGRNGRRRGSGIVIF